MTENEATKTAQVAPERPRGSPLYELSHLERTFSKGGVSVKAVRGVDLVIKSGEMVSLEGPSGSGKTTLLQLLGALDSPTGGSIRFEGRDLGGLNDKELTKIRAQQIGFRVPALQPHPDAYRRGERRHRDVPEPCPRPRAPSPCQGAVEPGRPRPAHGSSAVPALRW